MHLLAIILLGGVALDAVPQHDRDGGRSTPDGSAHAVARAPLPEWISKFLRLPYDEQLVEFRRLDLQQKLDVYDHATFSREPPDLRFLHDLDSQKTSVIVPEVLKRMRRCEEARCLERWLFLLS